MEPAALRLLWRFKMELYAWLLNRATDLWGAEADDLGNSDSEMNGYPVVNG